MTVTRNRFQNNWLCVRFHYGCVLIFLLHIAVISGAQQRLVCFDHPDLFYQGRLSERNESYGLSWPGSSISITFKGSSIHAVLQDSDTADYFNVILDGIVLTRIHIDTGKRSYLLASGISKGRHTIQLFKQTEAEKGTAWFYGFEIGGKAKLKKTQKPERKIEFYGNSITCGYAIEDSSGKDSGKGYFESNYDAYGAITARHFKAQYQCIAKSGIGMMISWGPVIIPEIYDRVLESDSLSKWDFSKYRPDVVVINIFQNDAWLTKLPDHPQFRIRFPEGAPEEQEIIARYKSFVQGIRAKYPGATIICALGNMDATKEGSLWPGYIQQAVKELNDKKIFTHFFPYKKTKGHPSRREQKQMADSLIEFIEKNIKW